MDERGNAVTRERVDAWKRKFHEKLGRERLSIIEGYVVAGAIFDILDEIWTIHRQITITNKDEKTNQNDVCIYRMIRYPPSVIQKKRYSEQ